MTPPNAINPYLKNLIIEHSIKVLEEGQTFTLSSGQKSRVYCDLKKTILRGSAQHALWSNLIEATNEFQPTAFAGVALGGCHLASIMACEGRDVIYIRKEAKNHGTQSLIESPNIDRSTARVVLLEDVITTGESTKKALQVLHKDGYNVVGIVTIVDRSEVPPSSLEGVPVKHLFLLKDLVGLH